MTLLTSRRTALLGGFAAALLGRLARAEDTAQKHQPGIPPATDAPETPPAIFTKISDDVVLIARTSKDIAIILTQDDDNNPPLSAKQDTYCGIGIAQHILVSEDKSSAAPYYELGAMFINQDDCTVTAYGLKGLKRSIGSGNKKHPDAGKALLDLQLAVAKIQGSPDLIKKMQDYSDLAGVRSCRPSQEARRNFLQRFIIT